MRNRNEEIDSIANEFKNRLKQTELNKLMQEFRARLREEGFGDYEIMAYPHNLKLYDLLSKLKK